MLAAGLRIGGAGFWLGAAGGRLASPGMRLGCVPGRLWRVASLWVVLVWGVRRTRRVFWRASGGLLRGFGTGGSQGCTGRGVHRI